MVFPFKEATLVFRPSITIPWPGNCLAQLNAPRVPAHSLCSAVDSRSVIATGHTHLIGLNCERSKFTVRAKSRRWVSFLEIADDGARRPKNEMLLLAAYKA